MMISKIVLKEDNPLQKIGWRGGVQINKVSNLSVEEHTQINDL